MLLTSQARGVYPIAPTPFFDDGRIDTASIDRLVDFYLGIGATGLLSNAAMRAPAAVLSVTARGEVEHLLGRLARHDPRARLAPG